jgi:hypothetical protein
MSGDSLPAEQFEVDAGLFCAHSLVRVSHAVLTNTKQFDSVSSFGSDQRGRRLRAALWLRSRSDGGVTVVARCHPKETMIEHNPQIGIFGEK